MDELCRLNDLKLGKVELQTCVIALCTHMQVLPNSFRTTGVRTMNNRFETGVTLLFKRHATMIKILDEWLLLWEQELMT